MAIYYHGTIIKNLKELKPFVSPDSNLKYPCVYLTSNKAIAAIYIWNKPFKWMSFHVQDDGIPVVTESFPNHLYEFYNGVSGCIYTCEGDFITDYAVGIKYAAISKEPVKIIDCDIVDNAYERLLQYEREGKLIINRFENLTQDMHDGRTRTILRTIKNLNLLEEKHPLSVFIKEKFPDLWEQAKKEIKKDVTV